MWAGVSPIWVHVSVSHPHLSRVLQITLSNYSLYVTIMVIAAMLWCCLQLIVAYLDTYLMIGIRFLSAAACKALAPQAVRTLTNAPRVSRSSTSSRFPFTAAQYTGLPSSSSPCWSSCHGSHVPLSNRSVTNSVSPCLIARGNIELSICLCITPGQSGIGLYWICFSHVFSSSQLGFNVRISANYLWRWL